MGNSDFLLSKGLSAGLGLGLRGVTVVVGVLLFETDEVIGVEETTLVDIEVFDVLESIILRLSLLSDISIPEKKEEKNKFLEFTFNCKTWTHDLAHNNYLGTLIE